MKYSQQSHSSAGYHNMTVVLFTLLCVLICGSLSLSRKAQTKTSDEHVTPKTVPGRNGKIVFNGSGEIYTTEADGSNVQRLTDNQRYDSSARWSPDGTKIAFVSKHSPNHDEIYVMNADGRNQTRLTDNPAGNYSPIFSPDGTRIAFASRRDNHHEIYVMNADGSNQTRLTNGPGGNFSYAWSPDSSRIAFVSARDNPNAINCNITPNCNYEIYVMNADGSNQTRLTNNAGSDGSPKWSPDGTRISFVSSRDEPNPTACLNCNYEIYAMNADGSNQTRLTNSPGSDGSPNWSPDGSRIAFLSNPDNNYDIYVMNADGSNQTRLTNDPAFDDSPVFSPDGSRIAFLSNRDKIDNGWDYDHKIYLINADGGSQTRLINTAVEVYESDVDWHALPLTSPSCPNPIDCTEFFVSQQYRDFLNREPDTPGLTFWTGEITECSNPEKRQPGESFIACTERKRANTSAAFFLSPEFQNTGSFVLRVYWGTLGKLPNSQCPGVPSGLPGHCRPLYTEYVAEVSQVATGIVVNDQLDPNVINANKRAFIEQFVTKPAFRTIYDSLNSQQFVDKLFETTGINASAADRATLVNGLNGINGQPATETRSSVVFKVVDGTTTQAGGALVFNTSYGQAFYDKEFDDAFVFMEYIGYLRRNPDQGGYEHWLGKLKLYGNWMDAQMVLAFISSPEYRARFGQP